MTHAPDLVCLTKANLRVVVCMSRDVLSSLFSLGRCNTNQGKRPLTKQHLEANHTRKHTIEEQHTERLTAAKNEQRRSKPQFRLPLEGHERLK